MLASETIPSIFINDADTAIAVMGDNGHHTVHVATGSAQKMLEDEITRFDSERPSLRRKAERSMFGNMLTAVAVLIPVYQLFFVTGFSGVRFWRLLLVSLCALVAIGAVTQAMTSLRKVLDPGKIVNTFNSFPGEAGAFGVTDDNVFNLDRITAERRDAIVAAIKADPDTAEFDFRRAIYDDSNDENRTDHR